MLSVLLREKEGYRFYYVLKDGAGEYGGGLTEEGFFVCDEDCPQRELMLRTLVNKCMNEFIAEVKAKDEWGVDLARFGFEERDGYWFASFETMKLPHDCK